MRQYTFLNATKILYGTSLMNAIDITLTLKSYLESNDNTVSFHVLESFFKNIWINQTRRLYVYDQHYIVSPCEITERVNQQFKILLTTGGTVTIKKNQNVKKLTNCIEKDLPVILPTLEKVEPTLIKPTTQIFKSQINVPTNTKPEYKSGTILTYTKVKLPIVQLLKNAPNCNTNKKICFLFMVYDRINKPEIWDSFFEFADKSKYSIYVHSKCDIIDERSEILKKYIIDKRYPTEWGTWSLVEVQNRLLELGLKDQSNSKFLFMSDSHVPLHDFDTVYNSIMNNDFSFVDIIGRLTQNNTNTMNDVFNIGKSNMFKMSQWSCLNRKHAEQLLEHENDMKLQSQFSIIPDENAYICTLTGLYFPKKVENLYNKNLTFVDWVIPSTNKMYRAHPRTYDNNELTKLIPTLRNEFLFVRKISQNCNIDRSIIQPYALTMLSYPQFANVQQMSSKTIVSAYCKHTKNTSSDLRNFWGFGDMLRGTISIYKLSQEFGTQFYLDTLDHPIGKYIKRQQSIQGYDEQIEKSKNNIYTFYRYFELTDFVKRNLITSNFVVVHSNAVYKDRNNMIEEENASFLSDSDKLFLLKFFEPTAELQSIINVYQKQLPEYYNIIHFRIGDDYFNSKIDTLHLEQLESIFVKHYEKCDVLLTDNDYFKQYIKNKYGCLTLDTNIVHVGLSNDSSGVKETLVEWFIQSKSSRIKTYSTYGWISGFVFWTHQLFTIPLTNMKKPQ